MNLVIVSNRLPYAAVRGEGGEWRVERGGGGLVTALRPVLCDRGGKWIGWVGATQEELPDPAAFLHLSLISAAVNISRALDGKPSGRHGQRPED
jgi:trehalose-6-phosphate synthase